MNYKHLAAIITSLTTCGSTPISCNQTEISVLTYNVHGLPESVAGTQPKDNMPSISPLLNEYDIVSVQEDFFYHPELSSKSEHLYQTPSTVFIEREGSIVNPSGLFLFSNSPLDKYFGQRWYSCNGTVDQSSDCLAPKGFAVAYTEVTPGIWVDVYDCHMDAGNSLGDKEARDKQILQLAAVLNTRSRYRAVIVACDTNLEQEDEYQLEKLLSLTGLKDSCRELNCPEPYNIDRIMYRNGIAVQLEPTSWYIPQGFVNEKEEDLSDHKPVAVEFTVKITP